MTGAGLLPCNGPMPCDTHRSSDDACPHCFVDDLLSLDSTLMNLDVELTRLEERYRKMALSSGEDEHCRVVIASVNQRLKKQRFGASQVEPRTIHPHHRDAYRARLRQLGTWIGFAELQTLSRLFSAVFYVALPTSEGHCRLYEINGTGRPAVTITTSPVIHWTGSHYELVMLRPIHLGNGIHAIDRRRQTNAHGDCGLESFLLHLCITAYLRLPSGTYRSFTLSQRQTTTIELLLRFRTLVDRAGIGNMHRDLDRLLDHQSEDYQDIILKLRDLLAENMTDAEVNDAIVAEGVPTTSRRTKVTRGSTWHELMKIREARTMALSCSELAPMHIGVVDGGFDTGHQALRSHTTLVGERNGDSSHGTPCAGLLAGDEDSSKNFLGGVARPEEALVTYLHAMAYDPDSTVADDMTSCQDLIRDEQVGVISMSYRTLGEKLAVLGNALSERRHGGLLGQCVFVVAAGNERKAHSSNELFVLGQHAIVVTATSLYEDKNGVEERKIVDCKSGLGVTLCAPGSDTRTSKRDCLSVISTDPGNRYSEFSNTSAATPMVAGVVALMQAVDPSLRHDEVKEILCLTADKIDGKGGEWGLASKHFRPGQVSAALMDREYSFKYGFGRVNAEAAILEVILRKSQRRSVSTSVVKTEVWESKKGDKKPSSRVQARKK